MANASVEKLKALGIRHGEKALVGLTAAVFVVFTVMAIVQPTLDIKPEQLKTAANQAESNLQKQQDPKDILTKLEEGGLKNPDFEKMVVNQQANALKPSDYRAKLDWITPEPGAGLIRDQPELIAPTELAAFPGRGGIVMYALEKGERVPNPVGTVAKSGTSKRRGNKMGMPGMMGGMMGGPPPVDNSPEGKKKAALEEEKRKRLFAGAVDGPADKEKDKEKDAKVDDGSAEPPTGWKEETKGKRWVVITGVIDNEQMKKNWLVALKNPAIAYPNYRALAVQRQTRESDGSWTDWASIDRDKCYEVLDNIPEKDAEFVPEPKRPASLNDDLPFLRAGYWSGVHVSRLVPAEIRDPAKGGAPGAMGGFPGGGPGGMMGGGPGRGMGMMGPGGKGGMMGMAGGMMGGEGPGGMAGMGGGSGSGGPEEIAFTKSDEAALMVRALDFTVEQDKTYRFRVRIVVFNPNKGHVDVNPGVDVESEQLVGPWSEPTNDVTIPADVASYAQASIQSDRRRDQVAFQVIRWDPVTGQTVLKNDEAGPGEMVGEYGTVQMPSSEGGGPKSTGIDFNSRAIVLDTMGGREKLPDIGVERNQFDIPALAMVVQSDGSVAIKSQAIDKADEVREDMESNYKQAIEDSGSARKPGGGSRMPGAPGKKKRKKR